MDSLDKGLPESHKQLSLDYDQPRQLAQYDGSQPGQSQQDEDEDVINLRDYWRVIVNRKGTILTFLSIIVIGTLIATFLMTPIYRSTVTLQIERESAKVVDYQSASGEEGGSDKDFYQTQYQLLKSRTLARRVINQLGLDSSQPFLGTGEESFFSDVTGSFKGLFAGEEVDEVEGEGQPADLETLFLSNLTVKPVRNSKLVSISYDSPNKELAASIVNALAKNYINTTLERRFEASSYAKTFISERLKQVRADLEDSERKLVKYSKDRDIIDLDAKRAVIMARVNGFNEKIIEAEANRIEVETRYKGMQELGTGAFISVLEDPVIQQYKETLAELERQYENDLRIYKPAFPKMEQQKSQIDDVKEKINEAVGNVRSAVKARYMARVREEAVLQAKMAELKNQLLELNDRSTDYSVLKRDVSTNRDLYDGLLQRMKEVGVVAGVGTNNISVVDPGEVPRRPIKPNKAKNLLLAFVLGLFGGIGLAFLFEHLDDTIKTGADLERITGLALLGIIPDISDDFEEEDSIALITYDEPTSHIAEAYRSCRTSLMYSTTAGIPKVLQVTSASAAEGKTTTSFSLAITFAQTGKNVLLINGDLRNPSLQRELGLANDIGLTSYLAGDTLLSKIVVPTEIPNLFAITTGPLPPNPAELLSSTKMQEMVHKVSNKFDMVIIDSPPVLGLADSLVLANISTATLMVVASGTTRTGALEGSLTRLRRARANLVGAVLTKHDQGAADYGYDYNYNYSYGAGAPMDEELEGQPQKQIAS